MHKKVNKSIQTVCLMIMVATIAAACTDLSKPEAQPSKAIEFTPSPAETQTETIIPKIDYTQTVTITPTIDYTQTAVSIVGKLEATAQPVITKLSTSPDKKWRAELVTYPCIEIKIDAPLPEKHAFDILRIVDLTSGKSHQIASQLQYCEGLGAFGLGQIAWSQNSQYYYYTDAREGSPDGGGLGWMRTAYRYDMKTHEVYVLGPAALSPDQKAFATVEQFVNGQWLSSPAALVIWDINGPELFRFETNFEPNTSGILHAAWSPTSEDLAYIETACTQAPNCSTNLFLVNRVSGTRVILIENHKPAFQAVSWVEPARLNLIDVNFQEWIYTFADGIIKLK